ncbi:MAG: Gfo/Idh/MocA family oxidoreductase [Halioglobus sp.]
MPAVNPPKIIVVGARSARQGTGPFVAAGLAEAGAHISGIIGTSDESVSAALAGLKNDWGIQTEGFTDLAVALAQLQPDAVAICSPWRFHAEQLDQVAKAGCHCLVEKPLAWPASQERVDQLVSKFEDHNLLLHLVGQWPTTLSAFCALHGDLPDKIDRFSMRLSPISIGEDMITDAAPHFISMLQSLAGPGDCLSCTIEIDSGNEKLALACNYQHGSGCISARLLLETCSERPRPAWYEINSMRADRQVTLPEYSQAMVSDDKRAAVADPMRQVTAHFLAQVTAGASSNGTLLRSAHRNLLQLAAAWR